MGRALVFLPLAVAGLSLAIGAAADPPAKPVPSSSPAQAGAAKKKGHKLGKHAAHAEPAKPHPTIATAVRSEYDVAEGSLSPAMPGAVCPAEMANVDDRFCVDRWEGSLVEIAQDGREVPWPPFTLVDDGRRVRAVSVPNVYPQAYISGAQAARACAAAGKRLCAPVEWRKACMGPEPSTFGYGTQHVSGKCNDGGTSPMLRLYPQVAVSWTTVGMTEMNDPRLNQLDGTLAPTGGHDGCTNGYGVFDMVGNLHEWTNDPNGTFQGGYYLDTHKNGDGCTYRTVAHEFTYHDYSTGFRCCASPVAP
jgi:sulfatase modifying factor 1